MTTHYQKIQALGNRMVTNLAAKGVSAQFSDGGLTLADKILEINQFNDGVFLASDKKIAQSSNTVHLSAMVVDEGMFKVGEPVIIEDKVNTTPIYTKTKINEDPTLPDTLNDNIGSGRWALTFGSYSGSADAPFILVRTSEYDELTISKTSTGFDIESNISYEGSTDYLEGSLTGSILYYCEGELFTDTGDSLIEEWFNVNDFNMSIAQYVEGSVSLYRIYGGGITGDSGAVSGIYTCSGAGKKEIVAKSGSVVSQPSTVIDGVYCDTDGTGTGVTVRMTRTASSGANVLTATGDSAHWIFKENNAVFDYPLIVEFDITNINKTVAQDSPSLNVHSANNDDYWVWFDSVGHYKFLITKNGVVKLEGSQNFDISGSHSTVASGSTSIKARLSFLLQHTNDSITFDNLAIYVAEDDSEITDWDLGANALMMKDSTGILLRNSGSSVTSGYLNKHGTDPITFDWSYPVKIQFEVVTMASTKCQLHVRAIGTGTSSSPNGTQKAWDLNASSLGIRAGDIISVETTSGHWVLKVNGTTKEEVTYDNTNYRVGLLPNANNSFRFKNFSITDM